MLRSIACDPRYFWNTHLYKDFKDQNVDPRWFTPIIQGYVGLVAGKLAGRDVQLGLISRRSHMRVGTRFHARGIDDSGNVANFVETEQIVQCEGLSMSYTIIRGSVPVFWEQKGVVEDVVLTRGPEMTKKAFQKHFEDLTGCYGPNFIIDLLSDTKGREVILTKEFVRQLHECELKEKLRFQHFDFHGFCRGDKYDSLRVLVQKVELGIRDHGYFLEDQKTRKVQRLQAGVFRVNCLDSLDRTNVAQSKIGLTILQRQLQ